MSWGPLSSPVNKWRTASVATLFGVVLWGFVSGNQWWLGVALIILAGLLPSLLVAARRYQNMLVGRAGLVVTISALALLIVQMGAVLVMGEFGRAQGFTPHPNTASASALGLWVVVLTTSLSMKGRAWSAPAWSGVVLATVAAGFLIVAAGTRSLAIGLLIAVILTAALAWRNLSKPVKVASVGALVAVTGVVVAVTGLRGTAGLLGSFERGPIFLSALDIASISLWVGSGDGAWDRWITTVEPALPLDAATHVHSLPLHLLIEGGAFGLAAITVLALVALRHLLRPMTFPADTARAVLTIGLVTVMVQSTVDLVILHPAVYVPLLVGTVFASVVDSQGMGG